VSRFHRLEVVEVRRETDECVSVRLDVPPDLRPVFAFAAGQHLILKARIGDEELRRTYSVCSPAGGELRIAVKRQPGGRFSAWVAEALAPGAAVEVMPPAGRFTVEPEPEAARLHVAFAAGSGITPVISILATLLEREPLSRFVLIYGNRTTASIIFREELEDLKNRHMTRLSLFHVLSGEPVDVPLLQGRIDPAKVRSLCAHAIDPAAVHAWYLCGPAPMIGELTATLQGLGVERHRIRFEYFTSEGNAPRQRVDAPAPVSAAGRDSRVTVIADGRRVDFRLAFDGPSILDAALAAGADLPFACKGGVCGTCRAKVTAGAVDMRRNYALEPAEVEAGYVLTCQSVPVSDAVTVDYDA
jgi:ring-1,2-phenylacetyl-CoA epoxidase subunit PaaE